MMLYPVQSRAEGEVAFIDAQGEVRLEVSGRKGFGVLQTKTFVARNGELVLIDRTGSELASLQADRAGRFVNGHCVVERLNRRTKQLQKGLTDSMGKWVVEPLYINLTDVHEGHYARRETETQLYSLFSVSGRLVLENFDICASRVAESVIAAANSAEPGRIGYKQLDGSWLIEPEFDTARPFFSGIAAVVSRIKNNYKATFIDKSRQELATFSGIEGFEEEFSDGVIGFHSPNIDGYLDVNGNRVCEGDFPILGTMHHGAAPVKSKGKWGLIGKDGKWRRKPEFDRLHEQHGPFFVFRNKSSLTALTVINPEGRLIWPQTRSLPVSRR